LAPQFGQFENPGFFDLGRAQPSLKRVFQIQFDNRLRPAPGPVFNRFRIAAMIASQPVFARIKAKIRPAGVAGKAMLFDAHAGVNSPPV
jgi:hypothetical protein